MDRPLLRFGGEEPAPRRASAGADIVMAADSDPKVDSMANLMNALSWKYVTQEPRFRPYIYPESGSAEMKEQLAHWAGRIWFHQNTMPNDAELKSFNIFKLEPQFQQFIKDHGPDLFKSGMTIDEVWASQQLYCASPLSFLISSCFRDQVSKRVIHRGFLEPDALVWLLGAMCFRFQINKTGIPLLITNGEFGHTIYIHGLNGVEYEHVRGEFSIPGGWFSFHDPWPARSLLTNKRDFPMVDVFEDISRPPFWVISPADLQKIVVGFVNFPESTAAMADLLFMVEELQKKIKGKYPLWLEHSSDDGQSFPILLAMHHYLTPSTYSNLVGLGQFNLVIGDLENALAQFESAYELQPTHVSGQTVAAMLSHFGHSELAKKWLERS